MVYPSTKKCMFDCQLRFYGLLTVLVRKHLPELRREVNIREAIGSCKQRCDVLISPAGDAAADARDEELHFRVAVGEADEIFHVSGDGAHRQVHRGDGVAPALQADALAVDGTEAFVGQAGGAAVVVPFPVAAEHEDLSVGEFRDAGRRYAQERLLLRKEVLVEVDGNPFFLAHPHFLVEFTVAGVHFAPHHFGSPGGDLEVHRAADTQPGSRAVGVLVGADVGESPALLAQGIHQLADHLRVVDVGTVFESVGNDGHEHVVAVLDDFLQPADGEAHRIVEGRAAGRRILFFPQVLHLVDGVAEDQRADLRTSGSGVEGHEGDHLMVVRVLLLRGADRRERFVGARESLLPDGGHRAAFIEDDQVVDSGFGGVVRGVHGG